MKASTRRYYLHRCIRKQNLGIEIYSQRKELKILSDLFPVLPEKLIKYINELKKFNYNFQLIIK